MSSKEIDASGAPRMTCPDCNGKGYIERWDGTRYGCSLCMGSGALEIG
jgi:DnaJ-class molecular chaperone